jgi:hypothetical protein
MDPTTRLVKRKLLYSPGFGAGWSTWQSDIPQEFACTYQPIIDALERGERLSETHPAIQQYEAECKEKFGISYVCVLGAEDLVIAEVEGPCRIEVYDGAESIVTCYEDWF